MPVPISGYQTLAALEKKHLIFLANTTYNIELPLEVSQLNRKQLVNIISEHMLKVEDCKECPGGNCEPSVHLFTPDQYKKCAICDPRKSVNKQIEDKIEDEIKKRKDKKILLTSKDDFLNNTVVHTPKTISGNQNGISLQDCAVKFEQKNPSWRTDRIHTPVGVVVTNNPCWETIEDCENKLAQEFETKLKNHKLDKGVFNKQDVTDLVLSYQEDNTEQVETKIKEIGAKLVVGNKRYNNGCKITEKCNANRTCETCKEKRKQEMYEKIRGFLKKASAYSSLKEEVHSVFEDLEDTVMFGVYLQIKDDKNLNHGDYTNRLGKKAEHFVRQLLIETMDRRKKENSDKKGPAFLLSEFFIWKYLGQCFEKNSIKFSQATGAKNEVDHDIMLAIPSNEVLQLNFFQVKNPGDKPWFNKPKKLKNGIKQTAEALRQTAKDVTAFLELFPELSSDDLSKIKIQWFAFVPYLEDDEDESFLCSQCSKYVLTKKTADNMLQLFENKVLLDCSEVTNNNMLDLYKNIVSRYTGVGSLVPMKTIGQYYGRVKKELERIYGEANEVKKEIEPALYLSEEEKEALDSKDSLLITGPYGSGKTLLLMLGILKEMEKCRQNGTELETVVISWEESNELVQVFKKFAEEHTAANIEVYTKKEALNKFGVPQKVIKSGNRVEMVNHLCWEIRKKKCKTKQVMVCIDEMKTTTCRDPATNPTEVIKSLLFTKRDYGDWSKLQPNEDPFPKKLKLWLSLQPIRTENNLTIRFGEGGVLLSFTHSPASVLELKLDDKEIKRIQLTRNFRSTNSIHKLLKNLHMARIPGIWETFCRMIRVGRYGDTIPCCLMPPKDEQPGHAIEGKNPEWVVLERCKHFYCQEIVKCILEPHKQKFFDIIKKQNNDCKFLCEEITIVLDTGGDPDDNNEEVKEWLETELRNENLDEVKVRRIEEFVGAESPCVIFLYIREEVNLLEKYNGWSRATTNLIIVTDDTYTPTYFQLQAACENNVLDKYEVYKVPEEEATKEAIQTDMPQQEKRKGSVKEKMLEKVSRIPAQRLYRPVIGRDDQGSFFVYLFLLLFSLPFSLAVILIAILAHKYFRFSQPLADLATYTTYTTVIGSVTLWWPLALYLSYSENFHANMHWEIFTAIFFLGGAFLVWIMAGRFPFSLKFQTPILMAYLSLSSLGGIAYDTNMFLMKLSCLGCIILFWMFCILSWIPLIIAYLAHYDNKVLTLRIFQGMLILYAILLVFFLIKIFTSIFIFLIYCNIVYAIIVLFHPILEKVTGGKEVEQMQRRNIGFESLNLMGRLVMVLVFSTLGKKQEIGKKKEILKL